MKVQSYSIATLLFLVAAGTMAGQAFGQGVLTSASGPVNRSMGGASVAAPVDAIGALRWNPATISALPCSELSVGMDLAFPILRVDSSIDGLGGGSTYAEAGVSAIPSVGWVHKTADPSVTIGLGMMGVAGFRTNYPASLTNPVLLPQSNDPMVPGGLGRSYASAQYLDMAPTVSIALTESLSVGFSSIVTLGEVVVDPLVIAPPDDADGSGMPRYSSGRGTKTQWGAGFQVGVYYIVNEDWRVGASVKSPTWMQAFKYQSENELGQPKNAQFHWDLPLVVSTGFSYAGIESTLIAVDLRYVDYSNAAGYGEGGFNPDGSIRGLGWHGVLALALGVQRQLSESFTIRGGYTFNQNPTPESLTSINFAAPLHFQHQLSAGGSYKLAENVSLNGVYSFFLPHDITGPIVTPGGAIPGSSVTSSESVHVVSFGIGVTY